MESVSLCPYLDQTRAKCRLEFALASKTSPGDAEPHFPFHVLTGSGPFARVLEGRFVTNTENQIRRVFVLLQQDEYASVEDDLWSFNNPDVAQYWQQALLFHRDDVEADSAFILSDQISSDGALLPFNSLFYCQLRQVFFEPVCPRCGQLLQLCCDDGRLFKAGLQPYSASARRYLYCPACFERHGDSDFYVFSLKSSDPKRLKDRWHLIRAFGQLSNDARHSSGLPCAGCEHCQECFEQRGLVSSRITAICFYPFYMLILEGMSVSATDFLAFLSGASVQELEDHLTESKEQGRLDCVRQIEKQWPKARFFSLDADRSFPEILYLKLCYLGQLFRELSVKIQNCPHPDFKLSWDAIWIKLVDQHGLPPFLWNFRVKYMGLGRDVLKTPLTSKYSFSNGIRCMGLFWFYGLLVNRSLKASDLDSKLSETLEKMEEGEKAALGRISHSELGTLFPPENIFWDPQDRHVSSAWESIWGQCLWMGWSLLERSLRSTGWSEEAFWQRFEKLLDEVKNGLFASGTEMPEKRPVDADHEAIYRILVSIFDKWTANVTTGGTVLKQEDSGDEEPQDTMVGAEDFRERFGSEPAGLADQEDERETLILRNESLKEITTRDPGGQTHSGDGDTFPEETFPRRSPASGGASGSAPSQRQENQQSQLNPPLSAEATSDSVDWKEGLESVEEDLAETVLLPRGGGLNSLRSQRSAAEQPPSDQRSLVKTAKGVPRGKMEGESAEEDLAQTVVLNPKKINNKGQRDG